MNIAAAPAEELVELIEDANAIAQRHAAIFRRGVYDPRMFPTSLFESIPFIGGRRQVNDADLARLLPPLAATAAWQSSRPAISGMRGSAPPAACSGALPAATARPTTKSLPRSATTRGWNWPCTGRSGPDPTYENVHVSIPVGCWPPTRSVARHHADAAPADDDR